MEGTSCASPHCCIYLTLEEAEDVEHSEVCVPQHIPDKGNYVIS